MNNQLENLRVLMYENGMEDVGSESRQLWAMWVDQYSYRGRHSVSAYLQDGNMMELYEPLMEAQRNGLVSLLIDDCSLIVELL